MEAFNLDAEQEWNPQKHVEKVLGRTEDGDFTVACWEPAQVSPNHCHPDCTEIYFCYSGGGIMNTPDGQTDAKPGSFVVHPPGELHEYVNGPARSMLFRVRYGGDMAALIKDWPTNPNWQARNADTAYFDA